MFVFGNLDGCIVVICLIEYYVVEKEWVGYYEIVELFLEYKEMYMLFVYFCNKED